MKFLALAVQTLWPEQTDTQIHRHTDRQTDPTEIITYPHTRMVKKDFIQSVFFAHLGLNIFARNLVNK